MTTTPVIGFTLDYETKETYSKKPWYAIRENYLTSISEFGAVPLPLPHELALVERYLEMIDGLIVTGGAFDIPPAMYGDATQHDTVVTKDRRTAFEIAMTKGAIARHMPVLGICGGQQLLVVALGGTLIQHIPDNVPGALEHEQKNSRDEPGHTVAIQRDTLLHRITGVEEIAVNSAHHQAAASVPDGMIINAIAPDGVIEGIEYPAHPFCLGVQWHPEYHVTAADQKIFAAFVEACGKYYSE